MKEIKITPPDGYEIDKEASTFDCIKFKPVEKRNLTWEEIQEKNKGKMQYCITSNGSISSFVFDVGLNLSRSHVPTERIAEKIRALCQLYIIAEYYNEGWEPDWNDEDQAKHCPLWSSDLNNIEYDYWYIHSGFFPVFKSAEILKAAYEANREIFETALKP